jgi:hypothetical protein
VALGILETDAAGAAPDPAARSLGDALRQDIFGDPELVAQVGARLRAGHLLVIPDAIDPALADEVWSALDAHEAWLPYEGVRQSPGHHFRHHNVHEPAPLALKKCMELFDSPRTKAFMEQLSGRPCGGATSLTAAWYQAGDYGLPHTDEAVDRTVSFANSPAPRGSRRPPGCRIATWSRATALRCHGSVAQTASSWSEWSGGAGDAHALAQAPAACAR